MSFLTKIQADGNPAPGYYLVIKDFKLSPGGGWYISLGKDQILKYSGDKHMKKWNSLHKKWVEIIPPIGGETNFPFDTYGRGELKRQWDTNTKSISPAEAKKLMSKASTTVLISVSEFESFVKKTNLKPTDKISITVKN